MSAQPPIALQTVDNVSAQDKTPRKVAGEFRQLLGDGHALRADGQAREEPESLLSRGYTPRYEIQLFGYRFFLCNQRVADGLKVMPSYVFDTRKPRRGKAAIHARVFYKDSSLVWRAASHYIDTPEDEWIGKGAMKWVQSGDGGRWFSAEETTNLPFEVQAALDDVSHRGPHTKSDSRILGLVLRNAPAHRVWPYHDFEAPRDNAMARAANRIHDNRPVAWFTDDRDPDSLVFEPGYEPDFDALIDKSESRSRMYGGAIGKYRIASRNRLIQYLFVAGPTHVWLVHPQPFTIELSSYGLRTVDVIADEQLFVPGYEFIGHSGEGEVDDQIPVGFAGEVCPMDPDRADASPWNDRLAVVREFRDKFGYPK